jgi:hypothetical protein
MTIIYSEKRERRKKYVSSLYFQLATAVGTAQSRIILKVPEYSKGRNILGLEF